MWLLRSAGEGTPAERIMPRTRHEIWQELGPLLSVYREVASLSSADQRARREINDGGLTDRILALEEEYRDAPASEGYRDRPRRSQSVSRRFWQLWAESSPTKSYEEVAAMAVYLEVSDWVDENRDLIDKASGYVEAGRARIAQDPDAADIPEEGR